MLQDIITKQSYSHTSELLLQVSKEDLPAYVRTEDDVVNRIVALLMTLAHFLNGSPVGGALCYLAELERRSRATPGLQFIVLATHASYAAKSQVGRQTPAILFHFATKSLSIRVVHW